MCDEPRPDIGVKGVVLIAEYPSGTHNFGLPILERFCHWHHPPHVLVEIVQLVEHGILEVALRQVLLGVLILVSLLKVIIKDNSARRSVDESDLCSATGWGFGGMLGFESWVWSNIVEISLDTNGVEKVMMFVVEKRTLKVGRVANTPQYLSDEFDGVMCCCFGSTTLEVLMSVSSAASL